jgi:hypothetical protein
MSVKMAARTGSESACKIPSTVMSSIEGWKSGLITYSSYLCVCSLFNSS